MTKRITKIASDHADDADRAFKAFGGMTRLKAAYRKNFPVEREFTFEEFWDVFQDKTKVAETDARIIFDLFADSSVAGKVRLDPFLRQLMLAAPMLHNAD